jgi:hypothetical protein
LVNKSR